MAKGRLFALIAIVLWATLASTAVYLKHIPPLFQLSIAFLIGGSPVLIRLHKEWHQLNLGELGLHTLALVLYHSLLFFALREPQPVISNVINYLWPLLIIILSPFFIKNIQFKWSLFLTVGLGSIGLISLYWQLLSTGQFEVSFGAILALLGALTWALYSVLLNRFRFQTPPTALLLACFLSGLFFAGISLAREPLPQISYSDWGALLWLGIAPFGLAFYFWDRALRLTPATQIGSLSLLTPLLSTGILILTTGEPLTLSLGIAISCIVAAALIGERI